MLDLVALWVGRVVLIVAGVSVAVALVGVAGNWWWRSIGHEARLILMAAWRERGRIREARERAKSKAADTSPDTQGVEE